MACDRNIKGETRAHVLDDKYTSVTCRPWRRNQSKAKRWPSFHREDDLGALPSSAMPGIRPGRSIPAALS